MEDNSKLITREIYVAGDGAPYEYESALQVLAVPSGDVGLWGLQTSRSSYLSRAMHAKKRHEVFDILSGVEACSRSRDDLISARVFKILKDRLLKTNPAVNDLLVLRNKFLAHAADEESRGLSSGISANYSKIDEVERAIVEVASALLSYVLDYDPPSRPVPQEPLMMFRGLEHPYAPTEAVHQMEAVWKGLETERNTWPVSSASDVFPLPQ